MRSNRIYAKICPACSAENDATAETCGSCPASLATVRSRYVAQPADTPAAAVTVDASTGGSLSGVLGWALLLAGILGLVAAASMDTSVATAYGSSVHNLALADERRNYLMVAGLATLIGVIMITGSGRR